MFFFSSLFHSFSSSAFVGFKAVRTCDSVPCPPEVCNWNHFMFVSWIVCFSWYWLQCFQRTNSYLVTFQQLQFPSRPRQRPANCLAWILFLLFLFPGPFPANSSPKKRLRHIRNLGDPWPSLGTITIKNMISMTKHCLFKAVQRLLCNVLISPPCLVLVDWLSTAGDPHGFIEMSKRRNGVDLTSRKGECRNPHRLQ